MFHSIPAGVGERMQYLAHRYNDTTIRFILHYPGLLDPDTLCAAAQAVIGSVEVLHASFLPKSRTSHWRVNDPYEPADFFALMTCDGDPMKPAQTIALQPIVHSSKCQMQVALVTGSNSCAVVVRLSHLVVDGSDGKYLLDKLAEAYRLAEQDGSAEALTVKNGSRSATHAYSELGLRDLASLLKKPHTGVKTSYPFAHPDARGAHRLLRCTIPSDILAAAKRKAGHATVNDLLLTACYRSYARATGREGAASVSSMMDLRPHCKDGSSEGLANMSGALSTTLTYDPARSFADDLQNIAAQTAAAKSAPLAGLDGIPLLHAATRALPMWALLQAADIVYSNLSLSMTNLGNIRCSELSMGGLQPKEGLFGGPLKKKPSVQVGVASFDGTAELTILGDFATEDLPSLQAFLEGMQAEIQHFAEENGGAFHAGSDL